MRPDLTPFLEMARDLRAAPSTDAALETVTTVARTLTNSDQATVRILDAMGRDLLVAARAGEAMHRGGAGRFRATEGLIGWCVTHRDSARVNDVRNDERFREKNGQTWMPSGVIAAPLLGPGAVLGVLSAARSGGPPYAEADLMTLELIAELATPHVQVAQLRELAETDALTGLFNRHHLTKRFPAELETAVRHGRPLAAVMLDLDHLKKINDAPGQGHRVGDQVLVEISRRMQLACRTSDVLYRWGGEEFLLLVPETHRGQAHEIAERILASLRDEPVSTTAGRLRVTASAGVSAVHPSDSLLTMEARVDKRLFTAKEEGRDRVIVGPERPADWTTFFEDTEADWTPVHSAPARPPDYESVSGSVYWDTGDGVYRQADHWGEGTHTCDWLLGGRGRRKLATGYCAYATFATKTPKGATC